MDDCTVSFTCYNIHRAWWPVNRPKHKCVVYDELRNKHTSGSYWWSWVPGITFLCTRPSILTILVISMAVYASLFRWKKTSDKWQVTAERGEIKAYLREIQKYRQEGKQLTYFHSSHTTPNEWTDGSAGGVKAPMNSLMHVKSNLNVLRNAKHNYIWRLQFLTMMWHVD